MIDPEAVRTWSWWSSPEWKAYTEAHGSAAGRPVHGPSYVVDLTDDPWGYYSKGHRSAMKTQMSTQHIRTSSNVGAFHTAHSEAAGRETRSQSTWDLMQDWVDDARAVCVTNGEGGWAYVICDHPGAYYASAAGADTHYLQHRIILGLKAAGFDWYELGDAATEGIATFKKGFASEVV